MNWHEAIEWQKAFKKTYNGQPEQVEDAIDMAIKALSAMPKYEKLKERDSAKRLNVEAETGYYVCPTCRSAISSGDESEVYKCCFNCGQRLDWSEEGAKE